MKRQLQAWSFAPLLSLLGQVAQKFRMPLKKIVFGIFT
jgi:hypothetical protein